MIGAARDRLHYAAGATAFTSGTDTMIYALIEAGAVVDAIAPASGATPLMAAAALGNAPGIAGLVSACKALGKSLNLDQGSAVISASALNIAAFMGTPVATAMLVELRANPLAMNDNGSSVLNDACRNPRTEISTLDLLLSHGQGDLNARQKPRTAFWAGINLAARVAYRVGVRPRFLTRETCDAI